MTRFAITLAILLAAEAPALAAQPTPTPKPLPINGVTVDVQEKPAAAEAPSGASHIERPPFMRPYRAMEAAPAARKPAPAPTPTPTPTPTPR